MDPILFSDSLSPQREEGMQAWLCHWSQAPVIASNLTIGVKYRQTRKTSVVQQQASCGRFQNFPVCLPKNLVETTGRKLVRWRSCPWRKRAEINKALKGSFMTQKAKNPQSPYNVWKVVQRSRFSSLGKTPSLNNRQERYKSVMHRKTKLRIMPTKMTDLCVEATSFLLLAVFYIHLSVRLTYPEKSVLTSLYIEIEHCDNSKGSIAKFCIRTKWRSITER